MWKWSAVSTRFVDKIILDDLLYKYYSLFNYIYIYVRECKVWSKYIDHIAIIDSVGLRQKRFLTLS